MTRIPLEVRIDDPEGFPAAPGLPLDGRRLTAMPAP
jgi:hypothetical protein